MQAQNAVPVRGDVHGGRVDRRVAADALVATAFTGQLGVLAAELSCRVNVSQGAGGPAIQQGDKGGKGGQGCRVNVSQGAGTPTIQQGGKGRQLGVS